MKRIQNYFHIDHHSNNNSYKMPIRMPPYTENFRRKVNRHKLGKRAALNLAYMYH